MTVGPENNVCQNCNTSYTQEHKFCNICGTKIPVPQDWQESAVSDDDIPIQDTRECPFCAELIGKEVAKCNHCGSILHQANKTYTRQQDVRAYTQPTYQQQQPPPSSHQVDLSRKSPILPVLILGILALLAVSMMVWFTLHGAKSGSLLNKGELNGRDVQKSCRNFVQRFYNGGWKGMNYGKPHFQPDVPFAPELLKLLNEDIIAEEKGEEFLDSDPVFCNESIYSAKNEPRSPAAPSGKFFS